jgi:predicted lipid-binding transport protein (Tim44 family)
MKKTLGLMALVLAFGLGTALDAEARRMGGGKSGGMQRQNVTQPANTPPAGSPSAVPGQAAPAAGAAAAGAAAKAAPGRSWMGPIAGLAAGIGLMALASHLGFGEAMANMMMVGLLVMVALAVVGFIMRKRMASQGPAMASPGAPMARQAAPSAEFGRGPATFGGGSLIGSRLSGAPDVQPSSIPAGFDTAGFERNAKAQFLALQEANDAGDLQRLRGFLTPEMYDFIAADIADRGDAPQKTEVFGLEARVLQVAEEPTQYVVSVRFTGSVRDQAGAVPEDLDEVWHLAKPRFGEGGWVIAGIQQVDAAG